MKAQRSSARMSSASISNVEATGSPASLNSGMISSNKAITSPLLWSPENRCLPGTCQTRSSARSSRIVSASPFMKASYARRMRSTLGCCDMTVTPSPRPGTILERTGDRRRARHPAGVVLGEVESVAEALQVAEGLGVGTGVLAEIEDVLEIVGPLDPWSEMGQAPVVLDELERR